MNAMNLSQVGRKPQVSRETIERICILYSVASGDCCPSELAERMGLSPMLAGAITEAVEPLVVAGMLANTDGHISLADEGRRWLDEQLAAVDLEANSRHDA